MNTVRDQAGGLQNINMQGEEEEMVIDIGLLIWFKQPPLTPSYFEAIGVNDEVIV